MPYRTNRTGWDKSVIYNFNAMSMLISTRRDEWTFAGEGAFSLACFQAHALSKFHAGSGRYLVYCDDIDGNSARIEYDACSVRDGVEADHDAEYPQHCNSGTYTWKDARTFSL